MREVIDKDEQYSKNYLIHYYHGQDMEVQCPAEAKSLKAFTQKRNYVKDHVIDAVCKVYRMWHTAEGRKKKEETWIREEFLDIDDLNKRVTDTVKEINHIEKT